MGTFSVDCEIVNVQRPSRAAEVRMLVDSGSEFSWVPEPVLKSAGVRVVKKDLGFVMANGQTITRSAGYAILKVGRFETVDEVVFGQPGDLTLLGARTLEGFGAAVDSRRKRLVAAGPHLAAPGDKQ
jgi:predicted aspartyl protease